MHDGWWGLKIILICLMYIGFFFVPHNVFRVWGHICRVGSVLFLIVQAYFILNACYTVNDFFIARTDKGKDADKNCAWVLILTITIVLSLASGTWLVF